MAFSLAGFAEGLHPALQQLAQQIHAGQVAKLQLNNLVGGEGGGDQPSETASPLAAGMAPPPMGAQPLGAIQGVQPLSPAGGGQQQQGPPTPVDVPGGQQLPPGATMSPIAAMNALADPRATSVGPPSGPGGMGASPAGSPAPTGGASPFAAQAGGALGDVGQVQPNGPSAPPQTPLSGVAQSTGNEFQDAQKTLRSILLDLKRRNPNARPAQILEAAQQEIGMIKGLSSETSALLRYQTASMGIDQKYSHDISVANTAKDRMELELQKSQEKNAAMLEAVHQHNLEWDEVTGKLVEGREKEAGTRAAATETAASIRAQAEETTGAGHDTAHLGGIAAQQSGAGGRETGRETSAIRIAKIRANATAIAKGKKPPYPEVSATTGGGGGAAPAGPPPGAPTATNGKQKVYFNGKTWVDY